MRSDKWRAFDLTLKGTDGTLLVHGNRCIVAARSPVFKRMLFGEFAEASKSVVAVVYKGGVLHAIDEYV